MNKTTLLIVAHNNLGTSLSGGDQIFLNLIRYAPTNIEVTVVGSAETRLLLKKHHLKPQHYFCSAPIHQVTLNTSNLFIHQLKRLIRAFIFFLRHRNLFQRHDFIYTASDFPADSLFGVLTKIFYPQTKWLAGFYLFAPPPFSPNSPYQQHHQFLRGLIYYFGQKPAHFLINLLADYVCITSNPDRRRFRKPCLTIQGGVDPLNYRHYRQSGSYILPSKRQFDAVYLGRLHSQKGVLGLVDIWKIVNQTLPQARLAIIGDGELKDALVSKISALGLNRHIRLFGFQTGKKKQTIFMNSKIVVHPATYDSGGMAAAEVMSWGLPGVAYDLEALKTYYPQGMLKTDCFDQQLFAQNIITLLTDKRVYRQTSQAALQLIANQWSWPYRLQPIYQVLTSHPKRF